MVLNVHRNRTAYQGRGEGRKGGMEVGGEGDYISVAAPAVTTRMTSALRWAAMRVIFNVSLFIVKDKGHKTVPTKHNVF